MGSGAHSPCGGACHAGPAMSLFQRAVAINASVIVVAVVLLAVSPASVSSHLKLAEAAVLVVGPR